MCQKPPHCISIALKIAFQVERGKFIYFPWRKFEITALTPNQNFVTLNQNIDPQSTAKIIIILAVWPPIKKSEFVRKVILTNLFHIENDYICSAVYVAKMLGKTK